MGNDAGPKHEHMGTSHHVSTMSSSPTPDDDLTGPGAQQREDAVEASTITVNTKGPSAPPAFPQPKTDKPRPHGCTTCGRAFARLEHLKRHERSHTKEKPFECPECKRCFARRDLLLRHQQKLHQTSAPPARSRNRRESASGVPLGQSRARKNSVAGANPNNAPVSPTSMRPRANTIHTLDPASMQHLLVANTPAMARMPPTHSRHNSLMDFGGMSHNYFDGQFAGMSAAMSQRGMHNAPLRVETQGLPFGAGLRTAPPQSFFGNDYSMTNPIASVYNGLSSSATINPNILHYGHHSPEIDPISSPPFSGHPDLAGQGIFEPSLESLSLMSPQYGGDFFSSGNENAIDGSSSSAISTASPGGMSDAMIDGSNNTASTVPTTASPWGSSIVSPHAASFLAEFGGSNHGFPDLMSGAPPSPHTMQSSMPNDFFTPPPSLSTSLADGLPVSTSSLRDMPALATAMKPALNFGPGPETPTSINGSNYGTSPVSTITDSTRHAILGALSSTATLHSTLASRRTSTSLQTSSLSAHSPNSSNLPDAARSLPNTKTLQRFVAAYITYFQPHLPFLHIPTLSFESPAKATNDPSNGFAGPACLALSMAAIGALYENEHDRAHELFELAKKMIQTYLEQCRLSNWRKSSSGSEEAMRRAREGTDTPVWLVQSMLLNVVFGHNCGDKLAGEIAATHCAALVSLARGADMFLPASASGHDGQDTNDEIDEQAAWLRWKVSEERKRTLYTIFILSSLLVSAYNQPPHLTNGEILLALPCDEEFFEAENSAVFEALGGAAGAERNCVTFHDAFADLIRASEKQKRQPSRTGQVFGSDFDPQALPSSSLQPSSFGCLILINALHNYIWETRQIHHNGPWTNEDTEKMHRTIEPALQAWHVAWSSSPKHSIRRPNPFNGGPLSADAMPLLDLAYLRLYVNLGRSKEKFWQRDWQGMAEELARGHEVVQHAEQYSPSQGPATSEEEMFAIAVGSADSQSARSLSAQPSPQSTQASSRREKLLRKAASFAVESLMTADRLGITFADLTSRELPLQSAMCAFDSAQILAEWIATLQDRVGQYLGILGQDPLDVCQVPAIMLLAEEDAQLLRKVQEVVDGWEKKIKMDSVSGLPGGYAAKILRMTGHMLGRAEVWPVTRLMTQCLETHANYMKARAERSVHLTE